MAQAKRMHSTSRRTALKGGGRAAAPVAALVPPPEADPIFGAIDAWRRADAACVEVNGDIPDELTDQAWEAHHAVVRTRPTTPAGLAALTGWVRERIDWLRDNASELHTKDLCAITAAIDDATRGMSGLEPWSPPLPAASERGNNLHSGEIQCAVCDLTRMARLAEIQVLKAVADLECRDEKYIEVPDYEDTSLAMFAASQMAIMAKKFEELYYSGFENDRGGLSND
jgi:hypothetical protein